MNNAPKRLWVVIALLAFAGILRATLPQTTVGTWVSAPSLSEARANAAAAMLPDGRILIIGGDSGSGALQSAEYFGADGAVSSAAPMNYPRTGHFAAVLSDGRVLVGGGNSSGGGTTNSAEVYDPSSDSWTQTSPMTQGRANATAALLQDGRVLIVGGDNSGTPSNTVEIFDPANGSFTFAGTLSSPRTKHAMAVLQDGRVLIVGGSDGNNPLASSDIFDPVSGSISAGPSLATARYAHSATTLLDGRVVVIGGTDGTNDLASAEIYDPANGSFSNAGAALATAREGHQAFLLPNNNNVLIFGGTSGGAFVAASELLIPQISSSGVWSSSISASGTNVTARSAAVGSVMKQDGLFLTAGGNNASGSALASTELYAFPTVKTDQADYAPGTVVTITGSGWQPGETVSLSFVESPLDDTHPTLTAVADANGNILNNQFSPDIHDISIRFYLTAVGSQSGLQALNTFTDSQPTKVDVTPASVTVLPGQSASYTINVTMGGNTNNCTVTLSVSPTPVTTGANPAVSGGANPITTNADFSRSLSISTTASGGSQTPPGTYSFTAVASRGSNCQGNGTTVSNPTSTLIVAGPATHLSVTGFTSPTTAGSSQLFTVTALDANNNTAIGFTGTVTFTSSDSQAVLPANYTFVAGDNGVHQFSATLETAGTQSITASASGVSAGTQSNITVNAGPTAKLIVAGYPSPVTAGTSHAFTVTAEDAFGNLTTGYTGTVQFTSSDGAAVLPANHPFTSGSGNKDNGVASFNATFNTAGTQSLTATDMATPSITGTQSGIVVNSANVATSLALSAPSPASVQVGSTGPVTFSATLTRTTGGAAVSGATINFTVDGNAVGSAVTNGSGIASLSTYNPSALSLGNHTVQASFAGATISGTIYNASSSGMQTLAVVDNQAPVVTISFAAPDGQNNWYVHSPITGTVSANDSTTGDSNITAITCTDGANPLPVGSLSGIGTPTASGSVSVSGDGTHSISCTGTDSAANTGASSGSTAMPVVIKIDATTPTLTAARLTSANVNGWNNTNVTVEFTCTDSASGVASVSATGAATGTLTSSPLDVTVTTEGANQAVNGSCKDNAGNSATSAGILGINIDKTKPVITGSHTPAANAFGWNNVDVTASFTCADTGTVQSGIDTNTVAGATVSTEGQNQSVTNTGSCVDQAGNAADPAAVNGISIDKTPPSVGGMPDRAADHKGWYNQALSIHWAGTDALSGIDTCDSDSGYSGPDTASASLSGHCKDKAGNDGSGSFGFKFDATAPTAVGLSITAGTAGTNGWYTSDVTVHTLGTETVSTPLSCTADQFQTTETTGAVFNGSCTNDAGLTTNASPLTVKLDKTGPTAALAVSVGTPGNNGWYVSDVTVHASGTDSISSPVTCTADQFLTADSTGHIFSGSCTNDAGLSTNAADLTVKLDKTPPTVNITAARAADHNNWYNHPLTFTNPGSDSTSGIASCTTPAAYSGPDTATASVNASCTDNAGNVGNGSLSFMYDATPPTNVTLTPSGTLGLNGWYTSDVSIKTTGTETISNPVLCTADQSQTVDTTGQLFHGSCTNDAGLPANATDISIKRDATPPVLILTFTPDMPDGTNGWWKTPGGVPFGWTCSDATSGIDASYNGGCPNPIGGMVTANGTTHFSDQVHDQAGNESVMVTRDLKLDNVAPVVAWNSAGDSCSLPGNAGWCRGSETATFTANDATSGLANLMQASFTQSTGTNGSAVLIASGMVTDAAGNVSPGVNAGPYKIDSVAPTIAINTPPSGGNYILNAAVAANYACSDGTSGVATCAAPVANGANFSTNPVGPHSFTVNAADVAGNPATPVTNSYSVVYSTGPCLGSPGHTILQPINFTGDSVFPKKQGSTVPAKFRVCDANGVSIGMPGVVSDFRIIQILAGTVTSATNELVDSTTPDTVFRWTGDQWIYNISTKNYNAGSTYFFRIFLNDGSTIDFDFGLK